MFAASVVENRNGSCGTLAIWARSHVRSSVRTSCPSTNTVPAGGSNSRGRRASAVLLPEAVRPTSGRRAIHEMPEQQCQNGVAEHRLCVAEPEEQPGQRQI